MSDTEGPGDLPPDVSPEYAEAYRRGYRRALEDAHVSPDGDGGSGVPSEPEPALKAPQPVRREAAQEPDLWREDRAEPSTRLVAVAMLSMFVALVIGAYVAGRILAGSFGGPVGVAEPAGVDIGGLGPGSSEQDAAKADGARGPGQVEGTTDLVPISAASATCQASSSVDAAGNPVSYAPRRAFDQDVTTAWRCSGDGVGESITLTVPRGTVIGEVGLIPGYAKTDPRTGTDRYAENRRLTRVRWRFDDGSTVVQRLNGSPTASTLQSRRVPVRTSRTVVMEILASTAGSRDTVAVSEIRIGRVEG